MPILRFVVGIVSVATMILGAALVVSAQDYPSKTIRIITSGVGGGNDFVARVVAQGIAGPLGQPVIVDNRASGILATEAVAKAPPDGYTLSVAGGGLWTITLLQKVPYEVRDFTPITLVISSPSLLAVHPTLPVKSVKELVALAKSRPQELNYGSSGSGTSGHLASELFKAMAGVNIVHVPYKGTAPSIMAVVSGEVQMTIYDLGLVGPQVKAGKLKALAVTSAQPSLLTPGLPTVAASGVPGYEAVSMTGVFAPDKTPVAIINRLNQEIVRMINLPDVKEKFLNSGAEPIGNSPEQFAAIMKTDIARVGKVIKDAGIRAQ